MGHGMSTPREFGSPRSTFARVAYRPILTAGKTGPRTRRDRIETLAVVKPIRVEDTASTIIAQRTGRPSLRIQCLELGVTFNVHVAYRVIDQRDALIDVGQLLQFVDVFASYGCSRIGLRPGRLKCGFHDR